MKSIKVLYLLLALMATGLLSLLLLGPAQAPPRASGGILDLREWDLTADGPVHLDGEWLFRRREFIDPDFPPDSEKKESDKPIIVPDAWNKFGLAGADGNPGFGYGTYRLRILLKDIRIRLGFRFLDQSSAHRVFINGREVFSSGYPGFTRQASAPSHKTGIISFSPESEILDITLWISNFHHWQGGLWEPIIMGEYGQVARGWGADNAIALLLFGALFLIGLYHLAVSLMVRRDDAALWFGIFCLFISSRLLTTGVRPIYLLIPDPGWEWLLKSIYICLYFSVPAFIAYLRALFPNELDRRMAWGQTAISIIFAASALFLPAWIFSRAMPFFQAMIIVAMVYGFYVIGKALAKGRENSSLVLLSFIVLSGTGVHDILCSRDLIESVYIIHYGVLIFVFTQAIIIARRFYSTFRTVEKQRRELVLANETIRESEERFQGLLKTITDVIWFSSIDGTEIQYINQAAEKVYGRPVSEIMEDPDFWVKAVHPEEREAIVPRAGQVLERGRIQMEYRILDPEGRERWLLDRRFLVTDEDGRPIRIGCIASDVTARRSAEEERRSLEDQLRQAQKMEALGTLAGGIAHDFNNILGAIMGFGELAQLEVEKAGCDSGHLEQIIGAADRGRKVVKKILTFSRKSKTELKPHDLNQMVASSVKVLKHTIPKNVGIRMKLAGNLESVMADITQMEQVIMNLANNASDAMPEGGSLVFETNSTRIDREYDVLGLEMPPGRYVTLSVTDSGLGMDKEQVAQVFDPFYTTKEIGRGTGLGLSIVYGIVKEHGGRITCYSEPGLGTTFRIYLPALKEDAAPLESREQHPMAAAGGEETLLLVDDEEALRRMGTEILGGVGYTVFAAASGEEALEIYGKEGAGVDLVILDLGMPGMGGTKCLEGLLELDPRVRVLIASGYSLDEGMGDIPENLVSGFIAKPYRRTALLNKVREMLDKKTLDS